MMSASDILFWIVGGFIAFWFTVGMLWFLGELVQKARGEDNDGE